MVVIHLVPPFLLAVALYLTLILAAANSWQPCEAPTAPDLDALQIGSIQPPAPADAVYHGQLVQVDAQEVQLPHLLHH
jgi:hypothetical protein